MSYGHRTAASRFNAVHVVGVKGRVTVPVGTLQDIPSGTAGERHK